jgi:hypothetical protein
MSNEFIWKHEGKDYTAKALTENDWKRMNGITRGILLGDCKFIEDREYRILLQNEIQSKDYSPIQILAKADRDDILIELTYFPFKENKGMTKDFAMAFWKDEGFGVNGFFDDILEASGIPIKTIRNADTIIKEVEDENPIQPEVSAEQIPMQK